MPTVQTGNTDLTRPTLHTPDTQDRPIKGRHREEHAHTVAVGILLARHRSEKAARR